MDSIAADDGGANSVYRPNIRVGAGMMAEEGGTGATERALSRLNWAIAAETSLAAGLALFGSWHVWQVREPDPWAGFALIALAALIYFMRGQVITKLSFNKEGFVADLSRKMDAAYAKAEEAQKDASLAKTVVTQFSASGDPGAAPAAGPGPAEEQQGGWRWSHPGLTPGPVVAEDPQKNQWGGQEQRGDRRLEADVEQIDPDWFAVLIRVVSMNPAKPLTGRVRFHLHHTFRKSIVSVKPRDGVAQLERVAYGAFTVGAEVENEPETYLELDMGEPDFPAPAVFKAR